VYALRPTSGWRITPISVSIQAVGCILQMSRHIKEIASPCWSQGIAPYCSTDSITPSFLSGFGLSTGFWDG